MTGPLAPPWTGIGHLQSDVQRLESALRRKVERHEIDNAVAPISRDVERLACSIRQLIAENIRLCAWLEKMEATVMELREAKP